MFFNPKRADGRPEWRVIFDMAENLPHGETLSYAAMGAALGTTDRKRVQLAVNRANKHLWNSAQRSLGSVRNVGYRVLKPIEHERQAGDYRKQSRRKMGKALSVLQATNLGLLENDDRNRIISLTAATALTVQVLRDHEMRLAHHDDLIRDLQARVTRLET